MERGGRNFWTAKRKEQLIELAKGAGDAAGKGLLTLLLVGGALTVAAIAPNVFPLLAPP